MLRNILHIILFAFAIFFSPDILSAQVDRFKIEYPLDKSVDAFGFDRLGYPWTIGIYKDELEVIKYYGGQLYKSYFPLQLDGNYKGQVIFIDNKLLISHGTEVYLFNPSDETYETLWKLPVGYTYDYSYQDDNGDIWLFITHSGKNKSQLYKYNKDGEFKLAYDLDDKYSKVKPQYTYGIKDVGGKLHFLYENYGINILNNEGKSETLDLVDSEDLTKNYDCSLFKIDNSNGVWRIYKDQVELLNRTTRQFERHPISDQVDVHNLCMNYNQRVRLKTIYRDSKNRLWLGGEDSNLYLYEEDRNRLTFFGKEIVDHLGGQEGDIIQLIEDASGNIWGRKRGGIFKITEKKSLFEKYAVDTQNENHQIYKDLPHINRTLKRYGKFGHKATIVSSIQQDDNENIYFTDQRFLFKVHHDDHEIEILPTENISSKITFFINDSVRLLSIWNRVYTLDEDFKNKKRLYDFKRIEKIFQQSDGTLWLSGYRDEDYNPLFAKIDPNTLSYTGEYFDSNGKTLSTSSMTEDDKGNLWAINYNGLYKINAENGLIIKQDPNAIYKGDSLYLKIGKGSNVQHLEEGMLGLKIHNGLAILNTATNEVLEYISTEYLETKTIDATYIDRNSAWYGNGRRLSNYNFSTREIIHFSANDGLDVGEGIRNFKLLTNGKLAMGTFNGLYIFHPDSLISNYKENIQNTTKKPIRLESYSTLDGALDSVHIYNYFTSDKTQAIVLSHNDKLLNLQFSFLNFDSPKDHQYSHWLEGYDTDWSAPISSNTVTYTSLPAGDYNLKLRANTGNGIWSSEPLEISITVKEAWYRSWWFYLLCLVVLAMLAFFISQHYYRLEKTKIRQEQEQAEAKRLKELDELKGRLFTNITHEFRTPLTVIMGMVDNIRNHPKEKNLIQRNSKNLLRLVNQLLDLSKADAKNLNINNIQSDIVSYLRYLTESFYSMATDKGIRLTFYSEEPEVIMDFDEIKIQHILYNLLSNAIKFTNEDGKIIVHLSKVIAQDKKHLRIKVQDTGIGISAEVIPHLFDRFYQADNSSTRKGEGTGIGLSLTHELVQIMDGKIEVSSTPADQNINNSSALTEFTIWLPIENKAVLSEITVQTEKSKTTVDKADLIPTPANKEEQHISHDPTLLIIEDNPDIILYLKSILDKDYQILSAKNGALGIEKAIEAIPDIIISDVMMPIKDGYEVCKTLKEDKRTSHIPIILLTAKAGEEAKLAGLQHGADAYLTKPFNKAELMVRLKKLVAIRQQIQDYINIDAHQKSDEPIILAQEPFLLKINETIEEHISNNEFGVSELAQAVHMSTTQVYRKLKALTGQTPSTYIRRQRLLMGKKLVRESDLSISEIAYSVGFSDPNYFSRAFHKEFGKSPRDHRN